jgi:hypothetical protein
MKDRARIEAAKSGTAYQEGDAGAGFRHRSTGQRLPLIAWNAPKWRAHLRAVPASVTCR